jgi:hypothetical protein
MNRITFLSVLAVFLLLNSCSNIDQANKDTAKQIYGLDSKVISGGFAFDGGNYTILSKDGNSSDFLLYNNGTEVTLYSIGKESLQKPFGVGRSFGFTPDTDVLVYTRGDLSDYAFQKANRTQQYSLFSHARILTPILKK